MLLAALLSFSLVFAMTSSLNFYLPLYYLIFPILAVLLLLSAVFFNNLTKIIAGSVAGIFLILAALDILYRTGFKRLSAFAADYFYWLSFYTQYGGEVPAQFRNITIISLCVLFSAYLYFFVVRRYRFLFVLIPGAAVFSIQWINKFVTLLAPFYIFLFALLLCYLKHILQKKNAGGRNEFLNSASFLLWTLPICLLIVAAAAAINSSERPIEWKWLDTKINAVYNNIMQKYDYVSFDYFSVASSGFGGKNDLLGGRVRLDNTLVLTVETKRNVYLKGTNYDVYTGTQWLNEAENYLPLRNNRELFFDTYEMLFGLNRLMNRNFLSEDNFYREKVSVVYQNIKSKSLFLPSKMISFAPDQKAPVDLLYSDGALVSSSRLGKGFNYSVEICWPKLDQKEFADALRKSHKGTYHGGYSRILNFDRYSSAVYARYLQIPGTVPQRVYDLAASLTSKYDNNYDKVKALEEFLSTNYPYNLDVSPAPRGRDFVDYFLFDGKEGYCTYYASALTIMARSIGIPARYVEGYILPPKPTENNPNLYYVTNQQAHAWTEVYFEGYGWLPFEATSPFRSSFYADSSAQAVFSGDFTGNPAYEDYLEMMKRYGNSSSLDIDLTDNGSQKNNYILYTSMAAGALILAFLLFLVFNSLRGKMKIYKISMLPPRKSVLKMYEYFMSVLALLGYGIQAGETPYQYSERIDRFLYFNSGKFAAITDTFVKARYSQNETGEKDKQMLLDFRPALMAETKSNLGPFKYFIFKSILGKL